MEPAVAPAKIFRFGLFEADAGNGTLTRNGVRVKVQDQPFRVLILLLERPGKIVSRDELRQRLWPEGTFVDFDGSLNVILKKLRASLEDDSDNPRFIETIPRRGYRFIAPVSVDCKVPKVEPAPADSVPKATAFAEVVPVDSGPAAPSRPAVSRLHILLYAAAAVAFAFLCARVLWSRYTKMASSRAVASVQVRKSIAVLGFHSLTGKAEDAWLATALSEMLSTELSGGEKLRLVSGEDVANLRIAAPWSQTDTLDQGTTSRIGNALSGDMLVLGSYTILDHPQPAQIRIDVRMQDARSGEIVSEIAEIGGAQDLFRLVSRVGGKLRDRLGVSPLEDTDEAGILASLPMDPDAARFYALGLMKLRNFDALAAKDLLIEASAADPKFSLGHAMLARAWGQLGYEQKRREEAKKALDLAGDLPRSERLLVEGDYYDGIGDHEKAASTYRTLFELFPDNVEYGLRLAAAQDAAGHDSQASETVSRMRQLPHPASDDPRIDLMASRVISTNVPARLALVRSAEQKALAQGKRLLYAQARKEECLQLNYSDHPDQAPPFCEEAYNVYMSAGNSLLAADALRTMGDTQGTLGHLDAAISIYQRALKLLDGMGEHYKTGSILNNMAIGYANEGKLDRAEELYRQAKANFEAVGDRGNTSVALGNIADISFLRGDLRSADKLYQQALDIQNSLDHPDSVYFMYRMSDLALTQGRVQDAQRLAQEATDTGRKYQGNYQYVTGAMMSLAEALKEEGDLEGARKQFQEAMEIRQKAAEAGLVAEAKAQIADLALEDGHPDQAEGLLRDAITEFEKEHADPSLSTAYMVLARVLREAGKIEDARQAAERAVQFSQTSSDPALSLPATIERARVEGRANPSSALKQLRGAAATAKRLGYFGIDCEARLAIAEVSSKSDAQGSRSQLSLLASDAHARGFELMARRAQHALSTGGTVLADNKPVQ